MTKYPVFSQRLEFTLGIFIVVHETKLGELPKYVNRADAIICILIRKFEKYSAYNRDSKSLQILIVSPVIARGMEKAWEPSEQLQPCSNLWVLTD